MFILDKAKKYRYEIIALLTGACVMMLEIVGARLVAPYFGTSTYVWTAMIGIILASLSVGLWIGGKAADKDNPKSDLGTIIAGAAILVIVMTMLHEGVLNLIAKGNLDLRLSAILAALVLFSIPSMLIGTVSPHLAKIRLQSLKTSGETIGRLEASGAIGSILGTFASGYFLLAYFGSQDLSIFIALILIFTSFIADAQRFFWIKVTLAILISFLLLADYSSSSKQGIIYDTDSSYARYQVQTGYFEGKRVNFLLMDSYSIQSAYHPDEPEVIPFNYARIIFQAVESYPHNKQNILVIGGGAHTIPTHLHRIYPDSSIDAVEIDQALDDIATEYFGYNETNNIKTHYIDGRTFLNRSQKDKYDIAIIDAYSSLTPPFHLSSIEAISKIKHTLKPNGLLLVNIASKKPNGLLAALNSTYKEVFDSTTVFRVHPEREVDDSQNYILIAANKELVKLEEIVGSIDNQINVGDSIILTDNYAPVERLSY